MKFYCVTPCLNAEKYIEETMLSVLTQTILKKQEHSLLYTIQDGGSTDSTVEIINRVISRFSGHENIQIHCHSESDSGMYDALARGFENGKDCDIYSYINAGDYYSPHAFDVVSDILSRDKVHFLTGINSWYNKRGHLIRFELPFEYNKNLLLKGFYGTVLPFVQQESTFWDNSIHQEIDLNTLGKFELAGDFYLWKTFISKTPLYIVSAWLGGFKYHAGQLSSKCGEKYSAEMSKLSLTPNAFDYLLAYTHKAIWHLPNRIKKKLSTHTFEYDHDHEMYRLIG